MVPPVYNFNRQATFTRRSVICAGSAWYVRLLDARTGYIYEQLSSD
jgi:hypothetical protein